MQVQPQVFPRHLRNFAALLALLLLTLGLAAYSQQTKRTKRTKNSGRQHTSRRDGIIKQSTRRTGETIPISMKPSSNQTPNNGTDDIHAVQITIKVSSINTHNPFVWVDTDSWNKKAAGGQKDLLGIYLCHADGTHWTTIPTHRGQPFQVRIDAATLKGQFAVEARRPMSTVTTVTTIFFTSSSNHPISDLSHKMCHISVN